MLKKVLVRVLLALVVLAGGFYAYTGYLVHQQRNAVRAKLTDPDSAKFRNETLKGKLFLEGSILCGEVNAKNAMGGYTGYKLFAATAGKDADIAKESGRDAFIEGYCE